jgi:anti-sigma regulatory factor (Ser/Thr protein kinase)
MPLDDVGVSRVDAHDHASGAFQHEAFFFAGDEQFVEGAAAFVRAGLEAEEPILVMAQARKIRALRTELGVDAARVLFADVTEVGANPARLIPAWRSFVKEHGAPGRWVRGIGEPIWAGRTPEELVECQRHEALLNIAFADGPYLSMLCLYDTETLSASIVAEAMRSHPIVIEQGVRRDSSSYSAEEEASEPSQRHLPQPPLHAHTLAFTRESLEELRRFVGEQSAEAGLPPERRSDLVLAVNELANNSICHGGGGGTVHMWEEGEMLVAEVRDHGNMQEPLAGSQEPGTDQILGRGLWLVNQLCDLIQMRTYDAGSVVRVHMRRNV